MRLREIAKKLSRGILIACGAKDPNPRHFIDHIRGIDICRDVNNSRHEKNALLAYITAPFFKKHKRNTHQNQWQAVAITKVLDWFGYNVDVINYDRSTPKLTRDYDLVIDLSPGWYGTKVYENRMKPGCKRIFYITGSEASYASEESLKRREALKERRGVFLDFHREFRPLSPDVEHFDGAFMIGNEYNWSTYSRKYKMPPVYYIINNGYMYPKPLDMEKRSPVKFLYFASGDQVHKGLDLLLEVFSQKNFPCELFICSTFESEPEFCAIYQKELYHTPNIHAVGFVDIMGEEFHNILEECAYVIVPSCSEARMGAGLTVMSAGLIPIFTRACGYDADEAIILPDAQIKTIERYVLEYAQKDRAWIREESKRILEIAHTRYTQEQFIRSIQEGLEGVLGTKISVPHSEYERLIHEI